MPQITLNVKKAQKLLDFCKKSNKDEFFVAKDYGAYVGASNGPEDSCLFYFRDCDPKKNEGAFWTGREMFGEDDFVDYLPISMLEVLCAGEVGNSITIKVNKQSVTARLN